MFQWAPHLYWVSLKLRSHSVNNNNFSTYSWLGKSWCKKFWWISFFKELALNIFFFKYFKQNERRPEKLQVITVHTISMEECQKIYLGISIDMACVLDNSGGGSCQGDSGSPYVYENAGSLKLVGVVLGGSGCGVFFTIQKSSQHNQKDWYDRFIFGCRTWIPESFYECAIFPQLDSSDDAEQFG